jgi:hypothetical protein
MFLETFHPLMVQTWTCQNLIFQSRWVFFGDHIFRISVTMMIKHPIFPHSFQEIFLVGGLEHVLWLSTYWEWNHHPNWRVVHHFSEG